MVAMFRLEKYVHILPDTTLDSSWWFHGTGPFIVRRCHWKIDDGINIQGGGNGREHCDGADSSNGKMMAVIFMM